MKHFGIVGLTILWAVNIYAHYINVNGDLGDWQGTASSVAHKDTISGGEWIYTGVANDERTDLPDHSNADIVEVRITADANNLYFLIKLRDITDATKPHIAIVLNVQDDITNGTDTWFGDDSQLYFSDRGFTPKSDRQLAFHTANGTAVVEFWDGGLWYGSSSDYSIVISPTNDVIEASVARSALEINTNEPEVIQIWLASFINTNVGNGSGDATQDIWGTNDALDFMGGYIGDNSNAWNRDLSDNSVWWNYTIIIEHDGEITGCIIQPDGDDADWPGTIPTDEDQYNTGKIVGAKFFNYNAVNNDSRLNSPIYDLQELRVANDQYFIYFLIRFGQLNIDQTNVCISWDIDQNSGDNALNWNGDDSGLFLAEASQYAERNITIRGTGDASWELKLYADDGSSWYEPPSTTAPLNYWVFMQEGNGPGPNSGSNYIEVRIPMVDLGLVPGTTHEVRISVAVFDNELGDIGSSDVTHNYTGNDGVDCIREGKRDTTGNAWDADLSDNDLDYYLDLTVEPTSVQEHSDAPVDRYSSKSSGSLRVLSSQFYLPDFHAEKNSTYKLRVVDVRGRIVRSIQISADTPVNLNHLPTGVYQVQIFDAEKGKLVFKENILVLE